MADLTEKIRDKAIVLNGTNDVFDKIGLDYAEKADPNAERIARNRYSCFDHFDEDAPENFPEGL